MYAKPRDEPSKTVRRRPRVSLLSLLLITAVVALSVAVVKLLSEVAPLRAENRRLRAETGRLTVLDDQSAYLIRLDGLENGVWKWRVHLPSGRGYRLVVRLRELAAWEPGATKSDWLLSNGHSCATDIAAGESLITARLSKELAHPGDPGRWTITTSLDGGGGGACGTAMEWLDDRRSWAFGSDAIIAGEQVELDADQAIELMTIRRANVAETASGFSVAPPDVRAPCDGVGLWIVPEVVGAQERSRPQ